MNVLNLVINSVNVAGIPANHLKKLNVRGIEFTESFKVILSERKSKQEYKISHFKSYFRFLACRFNTFIIYCHPIYVK